MTTCSNCGFAFEGIVAHCPRCEQPLRQQVEPTKPFIPHQPPGAGWTSRRRTTPLQRVVALAAGLTVGILVMAGAFALALGLFFCLDFSEGATNECAEKDQAATALLATGLIVSLICGFLSTYWLLTFFARQNQPNTNRRPAA